MSINRRTNLPGIQKIMMDFSQESETMDMKEEMMNDAIDDAMDDENHEEDEDLIVNQVLDEIGVNLNHSVSCPLLSFSSPMRRMVWALVIKLQKSMMMQHCRLDLITLEENELLMYCVSQILILE